MAINKDFIVKNGLVVQANGSVQSTNTTTGAIVTPGGVGIGGNLNVGGTITGILNGTSVSGSVSTASNIAGGLANQILYQTGPNTTQFITAPTTNSSILTWNGTSFSWNILSGTTSTFFINNKTTATSTTTGALQVAGGVGIGGNLFVGGTTYLSGDLYVDGTQFVVNTTQIQTSDKVLNLSSATTVAATAIDSGIIIGTSTGFVSFLFDGTASWKSLGSIVPSGNANLGSLLNQWNVIYGSSLYDSSNRVITSVNPSAGNGISISGLSSLGPSAIFTVTNTGVLTITAGTDTSVSASSGNVTFWTTSSLQSVTSRGSSTPYAISITSSTTATSTLTGALIVTGGVGIGGSLFAGNIYSNGSLVWTTATLTNNNQLSNGANYLTSASLGTYGVSAISAGAGISINTGTGNVTVTNIGVLSLQGSNFIGISTSTGNILLTNLGVQQISTGSGIAVSASTGSVTISSIDTLQLITLRGNTTNQTIAITATNLSASTNTGQALLVSGGIGALSVYASNLFDSGNRVLTSVTPVAGQSISVTSVSTSGANTTFTINNIGVTATIGTTYLGVSTSSGVVTFTNLGVQTLTAGTDTAVSASTGTITVWNTSTLQSITNRGAVTSNAISITSSTNATSTNTGALTVVGGVGVNQDLFIGGNATVQGTLYAYTAIGSISTATNFIGGTTGSILYQTAFGKTSFIGIGSAGSILQSNGTTATWVTTSSLTVNNALYANTSTNLFGGNIIATTGIFSGITSVTNTTVASSTTTGALQVAGGVGIGGSLYAGNIYDNNNRVITQVTPTAGNSIGISSVVGTGPIVSFTISNLGVTATIGTTYLGVNTNAGVATFTNLGVQTLTAGTDTAVSASTGTITVWNTSTLQSITNRGAATSNAISISNATGSSTSTAGALTVSGGVGIGQNLNVGGSMNVQGPVTFSSPVTFNGTATYVLSTNTVYTDNLIEMHVPPGGVGTTWGSDDGKDIGLRFHYYNRTLLSDSNAALVLADDSQMLEWYGTGAESNTGTFIGASYGGFKLGTIQLVSTAIASSTTTGALVVAGGVGIGGNLYANLIYSAGSQVITAASLGAFGVSQILPGTAIGVSPSSGTGNVTITNLGVTSITTGSGIAISTSTGTVNIASIDTLQLVTNRGAATSNAISISNTNSSLTTNTNQALLVSGGIGALIVSASNLFDSGNRVLTNVQPTSGSGISVTSLSTSAGTVSFTINNTGVLTITAGTDTSVSASSGNVTFWTTSSLQSVTSRGSSTPYAISITSSTTATSTTTGALTVSGGVGIGGNLYANLIYSAGSQVITTASLGTYGVSQILPGNAIGVSLSSGNVTITNLGVTSITTGSGIAISTSTGTVNIASIDTLQLVTNRGAATSNAISISNATLASSTSTGALTVSGGVGIGGNLYAGGNLVITGTSVLSGNVTANNALNVNGNFVVTGTSVLSGNVTANNALNVNGNFVVTGTSVYYGVASITNTTQALATNSGALVVAGGVGIGGNLYANLIYSAGSPVITAASLGAYGVSQILPGTAIGVSPSSGTGTVTITNLGVTSITTGSGIAISTSTGTVNIASIDTLQLVTNRGAATLNAISISNTTMALSSTTGALTVAGGVGIGGNLYAGGNLVIFGTSVLSGNVTANNALNVNGNFVVTGTSVYYGVASITNTTLASSTTTGALVVAGGVGIGGNLYANLIYSAGSQVITAASLGAFGVSQILPGTAIGVSPSSGTGNVTITNLGVTSITTGSGIAISTSTGTVNIASIDTLQLVTNRGAATSNAISISNATLASSTSTGALTVAGGVGVGGNLFVGGTLYATISGNITTATLAYLATTATNIAGGSAGAHPYQSAAGATSFITGNAGTVLVNGGTGAPIFQNTLTLAGTISATSTNTGALQVAGGVGIGGNLYVGGTLYATISGNITTATYAYLATTATYANNIAGGSAGAISYQSASSSTSFITGNAGTVLVSGGTGAPIFQNTLTLAGTISATSTNTGALQVAGGVGIGGNLFVGGTLYATISGNITTATYAYLATTATNIAGGSAGAHPYQSAAGATSFITGNAGTVLVSGGTGAPIFQNTLALAGTTAATSLNSGALQVAGGASIGGNLYVGGTLYATISGNITTASNILGGTTGSIPYQSGPNITSFIGIGSSGSLLQSNGTTATWVSTTTLLVKSSVNLAGGSAGALPYQSAVGATTFVSGTAGTVLVSGGTGAPIFQNTLALAGTISATSTNTGALQVAGGVGIGGNLFVGGTVYSNVIGTATTATSAATAYAFAGVLPVANGGTGKTTSNGKYIGSFTVPANDTNWWTIASHNGDNQPAYAKFSLVTQNHLNIEITFSNGAGGDYGHVEVRVRGHYSYWFMYPAFIRYNPTGTNLPSSVDIQLPLVGGTGNVFYIYEIENFSLDNNWMTYPMTSSGTASAGTSMQFFTTTGILRRDGYIGNGYTKEISITGGATAGSVLVANGSGVPTWTTSLPSLNVSTTTNIAGGAANYVPYQSNTGTTTFSSNFQYNGTNLTVNNGNVIATSYGTVTSGLSGNTDSMYCGNWFRSANATGWYNQTYDGGIYMIDTTYIRTYASKHFYVYGANANLYVDGTMYDATNTAYYVKPSSTSYLGMVQLKSTSLTSSGGGSLYLNAATSNRIDFNTSGVALPSLTTVSAGTKIVLYPSISGVNADFAIGVANNTLWNSVFGTSGQFQWYGGTTLAATLSGAGNFTIPGSSYISGNMYDSNNTAYYLKPSGTSNIATLGLDGSITKINGNSPTNGAIRCTPNLHLNAGIGNAVIVNWDNGTTGSGLTFRIGNGSAADIYYMQADGTSVQSNYAVNQVAYYAPIFYDNNNSAYFIDPTSVSNLSGLALTSYLTVNGLGGPGQWQAAYGSGTTFYNAFFRNDGNACYLLSSNAATTLAGAVNATYNSFRPFAWNLSTGIVSIDSSGASTVFGGPITATNLYYNGVSTISLYGSTQAPGIQLNSDISNAYIGVAKYGGAVGSAGSRLILSRFGGTTTAIAATTGTIIGSVIFQGHDGTALAAPANISAQINGTISTGNLPTDLVFSTTTLLTATEKARLSSVGNFTCVGNVTAYSSDERLKTNFKLISDAIQKIKNISGYIFDWDMEKCISLGFTPKQGNEHGVKAQEIQKIIPDAVEIAPFDTTYDEEGKPITKSGENYLTVKYERIVPLLIEAIKEQQLQIEILTDSIKELKLKG